MGQNKTDYNRLVRRKKPSSKSKRVLTLTSSIAIPRVVGEPSVFAFNYPKCSVRRFASENRRKMTRTEARLKTILTTVNGGVLRRRLKSQHVISGKWIVDFFFPEIRLAIEVDGNYHLEKNREMKDRQKELDCARFDITLVRVRNSEVFGDTEALLEKLRRGWQVAKARKNTLIGSPR